MDQNVCRALKPNGEMHGVKLIRPEYIAAELCGIHIKMPGVVKAPRVAMIPPSVDEVLQAENNLSSPVKSPVDNEVLQAEDELPSADEVLQADDEMLPEEPTDDDEEKMTVEEREAAEQERERAFQEEMPDDVNGGANEEVGEYKGDVSAKDILNPEQVAPEPELEEIKKYKKDLEATIASYKSSARDTNFIEFNKEILFDTKKRISYFTQHPFIVPKTTESIKQFVRDIRLS